MPFDPSQPNRGVLPAATGGLTPSLEAALSAASPRLSPPPTPLRSVLIHGALMALWVGLFARAFLADGLLAWSAGIVYVLYDTMLLIFVAWQTLSLIAPPPKASRGSAERPSLAVIVAAHNEAKVLPITLASLLAQTDPPDHIVVADDGSSDATADWLHREHGLSSPQMGHIVSSENGVSPRLSWLRLPHGGKARALNMAMSEIADEIVLTVDADTLLEPGAIAAMRSAFAADPGLVAATGILVPVCGPSIGGRIFEWFQTYEYIRNFMSRYAWARMGCLLLISGAFAGFRRQALLDVGGFDAACLVEDYELIHRLRRHAVLNGLDWTTDVIGAACARTDAPASAAAFLRQRRRWFGGFLQTQYWYRDMIGNGRYGWLGLAMLPVKAVDTMQPIYGLTAVALLVFYLVDGRLSLLAAIGGVIGLKILVDIGFHLWSVYVYSRWIGVPWRRSLAPALLAALAEPFCFQILRHLGAALGWVTFLSGSRSWGRQNRTGLIGDTSAEPQPRA